MKYADRISMLSTENAFEVLAKVKKLEQEGRDIISFAIGEPDFDTPENIKERGKWAIDNNYTHYVSSSGLLELRKEITTYINHLNNIKVLPENVVVTPGAKPIIFHSLLATINPGDEVIYPNPGFPIYESVIRFVGGKPVPIHLREERGFSLDPSEVEKLITDKTKMIIINSPHNPTGGMIDEKDLKRLAEIAGIHDLWILSDEIYSEMIYEGEFKSISSYPGMLDRTIIVNGFSKTYAMTGWRIGYGVMNPTLAEMITRLVTNSDSCTAAFTQIAAIEALTGPHDRVKEMFQELQERRNIIVTGLNQLEGISCEPPKGAFYVYPNVTKLCKKVNVSSSKELQEKLLLEANIAVLPQTAFGDKHPDEREEYLRFSFATSKENIDKGLERLRVFVEQYK